jgi:hypothetical protein
MYYIVLDVYETMTKELSHGLGITTHHLVDLVSDTNPDEDSYKVEARVMEFFNEGKPFQYSIMYTFWKNGKVLDSESHSYSPVEFTVDQLKETAENYIYEVTPEEWTHKFKQFESKKNNK